MTTDSEGIAAVEARLDGIADQLRSIDARSNVQLQLTVAMWVTTMIGVIATLVAVVVRT